MRDLWGEESRYDSWLAVELAVGDPGEGGVGTTIDEREFRFRVVKAARD